MEGCRPLTPEEVEQIKTHLDEQERVGAFGATRNKALFYFGLYTGLRISEILSFRIRDLLQRGAIVNYAYLRKENTKGKTAGRNIVITDDLRRVLARYADVYRLKDKDPNRGLWISQKGTLKRRQATKIYEDIYTACELTGKVATHSPRKTFASRVYEAVGENLMRLQVAMGHKNISSTQHYVAADKQKIEGVLRELKY